MSKTKRPPRDYNADLRIEPYPTEDMSKKELMERFRHGVKSLFRDDPPLPEAPQPKK